MNDTKEVWKDIPGNVGKYQASSLGRIRCLTYYGKPLVRILNQFKVRGYWYTSFNKNPIGVHRLVAMAFLDHKLSGRKLVVDHIDNDKENNCVDNLQILTTRENTSKDRTGTSEYTGVYWCNANNRWVSEIQIKGKGRCIGYFKKEIDAHLAYQKALKDWNDNKIIPQPKKKTSKYVGICWSNQYSKWKTYFTYKGKKYLVGYFEDQDKAHSKLIEAKAKLMG